MFAVFECDKIARGCAPQNERRVCGGFARAGNAMDEANRLKRENPRYSYMVGLDDDILD